MIESEANHSTDEISHTSCNKLEYRDCETIDDDDEEKGSLNTTPTPKLTINYGNATSHSSRVNGDASTQLHYSQLLRQQMFSNEEVDTGNELNSSYLSNTILNSSIMTSDESDENHAIEEEEQNTIIVANTATQQPKHFLGEIKNTTNNVTIRENSQEAKANANVTSGLRSLTKVIDNKVKPDILKSMPEEKGKDKLDAGKKKITAAVNPTSNMTADAGQQNNSKLPETKRPIKIYDTIEEFEANLPHTVTVLNTSFGSKVYLVGTAHFSEESNDDVSFVSIV